MSEIPERGRVVMQCDEHDQENCPVCNEERYAMYCSSGDDGHIECEKPQLRARIRELEQERDLTRKHLLAAIEQRDEASSNYINADEKAFQLQAHNRELVAALRAAHPFATAEMLDDIVRKASRIPKEPAG